MEIWCPPRNMPHLYDWWRPLVQAGARARAERLPWSVHLDEFRLVGRVGRDDDRDVWIYEHVASGGSLCVDLTGAAYRFVRHAPAPATTSPDAPEPDEGDSPPAEAAPSGHFEPCELAAALRRAGVPRTATTFRYVEQPARAAAAGGSPRGEVAPPPREVRRGHLKLV